MPWQSIKEFPPPTETPVLVRTDKMEPRWMTAAMLIFENDGERSGWVWAQLSGSYHANLLALDEYEFDDDYDYQEWHPLPEWD